jgi:Putative beta-lactamase-inhibitor-like, PepSY-like
MKKFLCFAILTAFAFNSFPQKEKITVPPATTLAFAKAFPAAEKIKWGKEKADFEADFVFNGKHFSAVYDQTGVLKETEEDIKTTALPAVVTDYVKQHYKNASIKEAAKITKPTGEVNYEAEVNKMDLIFDANGKFIRQEHDAD